MTYASGGLIQATDYNTRVSSINTLWGTGANSSGYGQSTTLSTVSAGVGTITATQWATLIARMTSMKQHQTNTTTGVPSQPTAGSVITYLSTVDTSITDITTNKLISYTVTQGASTTVTNATGWVTSATKTFTIAFSSGDTARYFFNSGGSIALTVSGTSLSGNTKSTTWNTFLTSGFVNFIMSASSSTYGGTGFTVTTNNLSTTGYYGLTTTQRTALRLTDSPSSADYTLNTLDVLVNTSSQNISGNGDNGATITISLVLTDNATDTFNDTVSGTLQVNVNLQYPETTYLSNTWSTGTIANTVNTQA